MKRTLAVLAVTGALAMLLRGTRVEDDLIRSLGHPDPAARALFDRYQERSPFRGKIFVEEGALAPREREELAGTLRAAGYREVALFAPPERTRVLALAPLLPAEEVAALLGEAALRRRVEQALSLAMLPGGDAALADLQADPVGLGAALLARLGGGPRSGGGPPPPPLRVFESPRPLDLGKVEQVHARLAALAPRVHFIGGDFFSWENYRAVLRDVVLCSTLTLVLNLAVFFFFTGRWVLLGLLLLGSVVSNVTGLLAIRLVYPEVFAVVLAYTSTFVGFNNESLVHLAGVEGDWRPRALLGIWSAIGTTLIGFLVLLLGRSVLVRQMALGSIGALVGFLAFLVPYWSTLKTARFRGFDWPKLTVPRWAPGALCAAAAAGVVAVGVPRVETRIEEFRYQTPLLEAQLDHFSRRLDDLSLENVVALPVEGSARAALDALARQGLADPERHPLALHRPEAEQERSLAALRERYPAAVARVEESLAAAGVRIDADPAVAAALRPVDEWAFLEAAGEIGPVRWTDVAGGRRWLFAGLRPGISAAARPDLLAMSPRHHFDALLTGLSRELGWLFLGGLGAMAAYLAWLQRSLPRVLYVFAPLFLGALAFAIHARVTGGTLNIVHIMGFSLVIALALDYTAVAVSADHGPVEISKVLLTGLSSLATFGVLILARHPVLRDLGTTVVIGCGVALLFALLVRLPNRREGAA